ncbi:MULTISPECIES: HAD family hydrolase [Streptomyces]|uniref:HAD superfamily hydrolase (TIGR01509 family) n=2 Tax=Streptomyces TaxID=1883 RepID=A0ABT9KUN8_9ACTN|nr:MULTISPECIES: HAD family hydrolase [Streptomyces]MBW8086932.1 HAD family hydrolase [Streptomyces hygroscopicus subsp. hygroscopicus]MCO8308154.1 HAD family hydrolase [Streptomyces sp. RKCA744]MDN3054905.1 HAD family hydrolase [Streptomyces sp. SRF1]MDP9612145.1 HAD superfamily hydrolase (TIGR01509 family) [Streptomyces demainii]GHJ26299.1 haloacid dehalogenase [Streptomyces hygroscopicus]
MSSEHTSDRDARGRRAALFDVDGTLVDTNYLHTVTWWEAMRQAGHTVGMREIHHAIGMSSDKLLDRLLPRDRDRSQDGRISGAHKALYAEYFSRLPAVDGAAELLRTLAGRGWYVVLASSAPKDELAAMRAAIGADEAIGAALSSDDVEEGKPAPDLVGQALERAGVPARDAVFVGDTVWDVAACGKAGVRCVALLSGGIPPELLTEAGADEIYRDPADLLRRLDDSALGR